VVDMNSELIERAEARSGSAPTPEELLLRQSLGVELRAALDALPPAFREAVWLRDVEEFSYADIARVLDIPSGTVMSRISRGRRLLYELLTSGTKPSLMLELAGRG
jgi:RNA polymerase sigma-70 factor, ECF subfamily